MAGITPASGYIESYWALIIAIFICLGAFFGIWLFKGKLKIDDALDVGSVHGITGIIGSLSIGFCASSTVNSAGPDGAFYGNPSQIYMQLLGVLLAIGWSTFWTLVLLLAFRFSKFFKLTVEKEIEILGLDYYYHGDIAYLELETPPNQLNDETVMVVTHTEEEYNEISPIVRQTLSARLNINEVRI